MTSCKPFEGLLILDLSRYLLGGYVTQYMADMGARVIKVEDTKLGDFTRFEEPMSKGESFYHYALDRNKESVSFNLKNDDVLNAFYELVKRADVVVENYRPGVTKRLGIDYETLKGINPRIIHLAYSAYGQDDPRSQAPLHDINLVAQSGYYDLIQGRVPAMPPSDFAAVSVGLQSLLTALYQRERTGEGVFLDVPMSDSFTWWNSLLDSRWFFFGEQMDHTGCEYPAVGYNVYRTKDDRMIAFGFYEPKFWEAFLADIDRMDLKDFNKDHVDVNPQAYEEVKKIVASKTYDEWAEWMKGKSHSMALCKNKSEAIAESVADKPEIQDFIEYPRFGRVLQTNVPHVIGDFRPSLKESTEPPLLGEQTVKVLGELGISEEKISELLGSGAVKAPESEV